MTLAVFLGTLLLAMAIVSLAGWIGMGLGSYQAGLFYDITANYLLSYGNAAIAGILNLVVVAALMWYRRRLRYGVIRPAPGHPRHRR